MAENTRQSPGDMLRGILANKNWTQQDLADVTGRQLAGINQIIKGKKNITPEMAISLEAALGVPAETWLEQDYLFRLASITSDEHKTVKRAEVFNYAPIKDMQKRGWLSHCESVADLENQVCSFFRVDSLPKQPEIFANARSSTDGNGLTSDQIAWCMRAAQLAETINAAKFEDGLFSSGLIKLTSLAESIDGVSKVPDTLAEMGIRLVVVEHLPHTKIDGAAFWLDKTKPVIALSIRYDRIDAFWHTLCHELSHIKHKDAFRPDNNLIGEDADSGDLVEHRANTEGAEILVAREQLESFMLRVQPYYSKKKISGFAKRIKIHPGIIVGQLQHRKAITFTQHRDFLVKIRSRLVSQAVCDGWGKTPILLN